MAWRTDLALAFEKTATRRSSTRLVHWMVCTRCSCSGGSLSVCAVVRLLEAPQLHNRPSALPAEMVSLNTENGIYNSEGVLLVHTMTGAGIGTFCDVNFTDVAATVACR